MKAAVLEELNKIVIKDIPKPVIEKGGMLVKVKACAVCGSDIRIFHYGNPRVKTPQVIGHEVAGDVVEAGAEVKAFSVGDRVAIGADVPCGSCVFCRNGMGNNCRINYAIGYQFQGGFAEYIPLNATTVKYGPVHKIPSGLSYEEAALAEPLACCINGLELSQVKLGDSVVVIGAGPIGCMLVIMAKVMGAKKVMIAQRSKKRLELARSTPADVVISTTEEDLVKRVMEETEGRGADVVMVACASPEAQEDAIRIVANRGRVNYFGGLPKGTRNISIDSNIIHYKEAYIHGSHGSIPRQHKTALDIIASGKIKIKDMISRRFPLDRTLDAFAAVENREGMKVIVENP
ncbi:L-threonine 3-dehydrogenase [Candidatus Desantisbacteria bacterium CG_4_10_14_0_8_um_filter_48_22]|uniref:L-threonine 3-dehydrogenase n=1 Tax=Candidatus Desantisbacteria bacterium CG_4_10_14_0_8_um_filter_48_22 TaxID=1974543 RepID=A0A2M7S4F2_9BACT|nr:MAG: L-threonine 3-dehydrogenase [Candidatus Desantisbacteria bacterium CG1_02_49_89]PIV57077.1 MAG: L-threonine 3-dehydrogenase [Candidatus Desantisbacteria bacterium CG02_land_8_20_14_3_00_49_13]PIZ14446.1 MAG: L-threonine 3-dehydrogenase [Candidatus Desantisbacteria bacterium CG_4_10_14_0_8_um_filter_48_22]